MHNPCRDHIISLPTLGRNPVVAIPITGAAYSVAGSFGNGIFLCLAYKNLDSAYK